MKVKINGEVRDYRTVWMDGSEVNLIDQRKLPHKFEIYKSRNYKETSMAIKEMIVRGAPAIGSAAAFAMTQATLKFNERDMEKFKKYMTGVEKFIKTRRPTAYDLFYALNFMKEKIENADSVNEAKEIAKIESKNYANEIAENCKGIGELGEKLIEDNSKILTHCNAGALCSVDYGTALSPIRFAHYNGKNIHVFVDETRPRFQGSKLTAWELSQEGISHSIIVDNAAGYFMQKGEINLVIVGADRITKNFDVINKIGTYEKAVIAKENGIPFYVAAPKSTFDFNIKSGKEIIIEERSQDEILFIDGIRIAPENSKARNPGFDITPRKYITGIITEKGILK